jgi:hypothetical protein
MIHDVIQESHPDLQILCEKTKTNPEDLRGAWSPDIGDHNYLKVWSLRCWSEQAKDEICLAIEEANKLTIEYEFKATYFEDFEIEGDGDRTWPAHFNFSSTIK